MAQTIKIKTKGNATSYEICLRAGLLGDLALSTPTRSPKNPRQAVIVSNKKVFGLYGEVFSKTLERSGLKTAVHLIGDGERFKTLKTLEKCLSFLGEHRISRSDHIYALGGGVVGDVAGFAASVYLRGIGYTQVPTTLLAMVDSSVGGKTGVNMPFGKNMVGSFYQPSRVLIDPNVLQTLERRELTAGLCECIKHAALAGGKVFKLTETILKKVENGFNGEVSEPEFAHFLAQQIKFKASIVAGDERESIGRNDGRSRKILNFGHTFAHALEKATNFRYLKHGEAVGHGILFAAELSKKLELLAQDRLNLLYDVVHRAGNLPPIGHIDANQLTDAFLFDKKSIDGDLQWILLRDLGDPIIVGQNEIPRKAISSVLRSILGRNS